MMHTYELGSKVSLRPLTWVRVKCLSVIWLGPIRADPVFAGKQRSVKTRVTVRHFSLPSEHRLRLGFAGRERWSDIFSTLVYGFLDFRWPSQLKSAPRRCGFG
ncbi:hypothetical protein GW17_00038207 [Ensete ventricosum]|nr:hypothetical protein GW17_00038207 [Ensete ventricosum]